MVPSPAPEAKGQLLWAEQGCATQNMSREGSLSKPRKPTKSPENTSQLISNLHTHSKNLVEKGSLTKAGSMSWYVGGW